MNTISHLPLGKNEAKILDFFIQKAKKDQFNDVSAFMRKITALHATIEGGYSSPLHIREISQNIVSLSHRYSDGSKDLEITFFHTDGEWYPGGYRQTGLSYDLLSISGWASISNLNYQRRLLRFCKTWFDTLLEELNLQQEFEEWYCIQGKVDAQTETVEVPAAFGFPLGAKGANFLDKIKGVIVKNYKEAVRVKDESGRPVKISSSGNQVSVDYGDKKVVATKYRNFIKIDSSTCMEGDLVKTPSLVFYNPAKGDYYLQEFQIDGVLIIPEKLMSKFGQGLSNTGGEIEEMLLGISRKYFGLEVQSWINMMFGEKSFLSIADMKFFLASYQEPLWCEQKDFMISPYKCFFELDGETPKNFQHIDMQRNVSLFAEKWFGEITI